MAASIFISYAHEDRARAEQLAARFVAAGWSVWWDRQIVGGSHFDKATEEAIAAAKVVVVLWSHASVASHWVRAEAAWALDRDKLLPVMIDDVDRPLQFFHVQTIDLAGSKVTKETPALGKLLAELGQRLGDGGLRARLPTTGAGQSRGSDSRVPRPLDPPRSTNAPPRSGNRDGDPASFLPEAVRAVVISPGSKRIPLAVLGAALATLIVGAGYVVLWDRSAPIAKHDVLPPTVHLGPAPTPSPAQPRQSAQPEDKNLPWYFKRP
jgi:hypothetical protein